VKRLLMVVLLAVFPIASHGTSVHSDATCSKFWNKLPSDAKAMWFHGYATAVARLLTLRNFRKSDTLHEVAEISVTPSNFN